MLVQYGKMLENDILKETTIMLFSELKFDSSDLSIGFYGYEDCAPSYSFGPAIREHFVIHYITKGKGIFYYKNQEIPLTTGTCFC